tara:strand:- start:671 stop:964 length:294 start_codon:yes stop_codon:yes gene_type:complete
MENVVTYIILGIIALCAIPTILWWLIKNLPLIVMSCSKVCCIILFLTVAYWACGNGLHNPEGREKWMIKMEGDAGNSDHNINTSKAGKAIVVEDDER